MEDDSLLDEEEDILIKETQDPSAFSKDLIKRLRICNTTAEAETADNTQHSFVTH